MLIDSSWINLIDKMRIVSVNEQKEYIYGCYWAITTVNNRNCIKKEEGKAFQSCLGGGGEEGGGPSSITGYILLAIIILLF